MFLLKRPAIWFWCGGGFVIPPLGMLIGPFGVYLAVKAEDRPATYAYLAVLFIGALWLSFVLDGSISF